MSAEDPSPSKVTNAERLIARDCGSSYKDKLKALKDKRKEQKKADERAAKARDLARARWLKLEKQRRQGLSVELEEPEQPEQPEQSPIRHFSAVDSDSAQKRSAPHGTGDADAERNYVDSIYQAVSMFAPISNGSDFSRSSHSSQSSKSSKSADEFSSKRQSRRSSGRRDSSDDEPNIETASHASTNTGGGRSCRSAYSSSVSRDLHNSSTDQSIVQSPSWQKHNKSFDSKDMETSAAIHHPDQRPAESLSIFGHPSPGFGSAFDSQMLFSTVPPLVSQLSSDSFSQILNNARSNSPGIISRDMFPSPDFGSQPFPAPSPELPQRHVTPGLSVMSPPSTPISTQTSPNGILLVDRPGDSINTSNQHRDDAMIFTLPQPPQSFNQEKRARTAFVSERLRGQGSVPDSPVVEPCRHYQHAGVSPRSQSYDPSSSRFTALTPYLQQASRIARSSLPSRDSSHFVESQSMSQFDNQINALPDDTSVCSTFHQPIRRAPSRFTFQTDAPVSTMSPRQLTAPSLLNTNHRHQAASLRLLSLENSRASSSAPKSTLKRAWSQSSINLAAEHEHDISSLPIPSPSTALSSLTLDARPSSHQRQNLSSFGPSVTHEELQRLQVQLQQQQMLMQLQAMQNDPAAAMNELQTRLLMDMIEQQKQALQCDAALLSQRYFSQQSSAAQMNLHSVNSSLSFSTFSNNFPPMPIPDCSVSQQNLLMFQTLQQQAQFAMHQQSILHSLQQKQQALSNPNMATVNQMLLMRAAAAQRHPLSYPENKPFPR